MSPTDLDAATYPWWKRLGVAFVASAPGSWLLRKVMHRIDRPLLRLTRGRVSLGIDFPVLLLTTTGAKTGKQRTVPLLYTEWNGSYALIGSRFGTDRHPGWYHNLRANPEATVEIRGERIPCVAREAREDERAQIWERAVRMYPGYETYRARTSRRIPVVVLTPRAD